MDENENELRRRFVQLREADSDRVPGFTQTFGRARAPKSGRATLRVRPLALGAAAAIAIAAIWLAQTRSSSPSAATPAIATWRAPTDVLLQTPGSELLSEMPALGTSILDEIIPAPLNRGT
ncbi:MAG TPA: hypothetical protein VF836_03115 [Gemmatimonadaceae bacterium]